MSSPASIHNECASAWNRRDWTAMRRLYHPDYSYTGGTARR